MVIKFEGEPYVVMDYQHVAPGNWRAMVQVKMRHLKLGHVKENRFRSEDKVEQVFVEGIAMEYLYQDGEHFVFMNLKTYDQIMLNKEVIGDGLGYLKPNTEVLVNYYDGEAISILMPNTVDLKVIETEPGLKGATVTNVYKSAKVETGIIIQVPPFVENGEVIRVDTREGKYLERVREGGNKF